MAEAQTSGRMRQRVAITGARGWLGRELLCQLIAKEPESEVLLLGRAAGQVALGERTYPVYPWTPEVLREWGPSHIAHLAFVTRERLSSDAGVGLESANASLTRMFLHALELPTVVGALYTSSGAATMYPMDSYARHKRLDELLISRRAAAVGKPAVIARVWSVSGRYCTKRAVFMLPNLIDQALDPSSPSIAVHAPHVVRRRFVDAGEFLYACWLDLLEGRTGIVDSGGDLIDNISLALMVRSLVAPHKPVTFSISEATVHEYHSDGLSMAALGYRTNVQFSPIETQILNTARRMDH